MRGIFDDERRGPGPISPDPSGTRRIPTRAAPRTAWGGTPRRCVLLILAGILSRQRSKVVEAGHAGDRGIAAAEFRGQPRRQTSKILLRRVAFIDLL